MKKTEYYTFFLAVVIGFIVLWFPGFSQIDAGSSAIYFYKKQEQNIGFHYYANVNREDLRTAKSHTFEELESGMATLEYVTRYWNFLDYKQELLSFNFEMGPLWGSGGIVDSSSVANIEADHSIFGISGKVNVAYTSRFYWDRKNYTLVDIDAWGRYSLYNQKSSGTTSDSMQITLPYELAESENKFRYGFQAKAGWGIGRLNPMNNYMIADYIFKNYFAGRNISEKEMVQLADEIGRIKTRRDSKFRHNVKIESDSLNQFIQHKFLLTNIEHLEGDFGLGEFLPRFDGSRVEAGPFFNFYNREPDFIYGAYFDFTNEKYKSYQWNRNFVAAVKYNHYKKQDWVLADVNVGASYYRGLRCRFDFGVKYIPGIVINDLDDVEPIVHNFVPYLGYFTQLNSKIRMEANASLRITNDEQFMTAGPEFSFKFYRSNY